MIRSKPQRRADFLGLMGGRGGRVGGDGLARIPAAMSRNTLYTLMKQLIVSYLMYQVRIKTLHYRLRTINPYPDHALVYPSEQPLSTHAIVTRKP
nr:hypothetical protein [Tanacetum cinerariifolium]